LKAEDILKKHWGFDNFRSNQGEIIESAINGHDTFALLPTGGGKSICFQVPGIAREGVCIVISPLIALMQDQVRNLKQKGIKAAALTSGMTRKEIDIILDNAKFGALDFLYVSPERLKTDIFKVRFSQMNVSLIAIDEAHCVSEWGHDFRPPYKDIKDLREVHPNVPMIAVTATATAQVKKDIISLLEMKNPNTFEGDFSRPNLSYEVYQVEHKLQMIFKACQKFQGTSGIVYCQTRRSTKEVAKFLKAQNFSVGIYNGGMTHDERARQLQLWMNNDTRIMVATNAFGMGIDKPDVRFVLHYEIPNNLEAYFQEAGRSGRDGKESRNLAFYEKNDLLNMEVQLEKQFPEKEFIKDIYRALCNFCGIAIGSGEGESYSLDIKAFIKKYNLPVLETYNAIKILQLNNSIILNEDAFRGTRLKYAIDNRTLYDFQLKHEKSDRLITFLSRSYPGIFSNYFEINENTIAKKLKIKKSDVIDQLSFLEKQGIIDITWQSNLPQIVLQHERLPDDYFRLDKSIYEKRKEVAHLKFKGLKKFLNSQHCRTVELLAYFGQETEPCGKCDICKLTRESSYSTLEMNEAIQSLLRENPKTMDELKKELGKNQEKQLKHCLDWLMDEKVIVFQHPFYSLG
jgi:ATP-dependent DNA helicase RecQ